MPAGTTRFRFRRTGSAGCGAIARRRCRPRSRRRRAVRHQGHEPGAELDGAERSTHYFWSLSRRFDLEDEALSKTLHQSITTIFDEDKAILEQQQRMIESDPLRRPLLTTNCDAGGAAARRIIDQALAAERQKQAAE